MLLRDFILDARASLAGIYPQEEARAIVSSLVCELLGVSPQKHVLDPQWEIPSGKLEPLDSALERLRASEPLQYVLGFTEFYGHRFNVSPAVLIPRPETELLVDIALRKGKNATRVLDLCTGSGCIAWSMALGLPEAEVVAVDISDEALAVASAQPLPARPLFLKRDVLDAGQLADLGAFDIVLSNPPYVRDSEKALMRANVLEHEPHLALFVSDEDPLLFYRAEASVMTRLLRPGGFGIVEINEALGDSTADLFRSAGLEEVQIIQDFSRKDRFVSFKKPLA